MRTEQIKKYLANGIFAVTPQYMDGLITTVNAGEISKNIIQDIAEPHSIEIIGGVAVITVDGVTTKKNTWMNAMCGGMIGYDTISSYVKVAEADNTVHTILFNIDTHGGEVNGCDQLAELIYSSDKKTVTYYDNIGASAGIWWGSASKAIYANKTAQIGSIGVIMGYYEPTDNANKKVLVSRNAQNKDCSLSGSCKDKFQSRIDNIEAIFHERVSRNTGLTKEQIIKNFNYGDMVSAQKAFDIGFLDGITTLEALVKTLNENANFTIEELKSKKNSVAIPTANGDKLANSELRNSMEFSQENFDKLLLEKSTLEAELELVKQEVVGNKAIGQEELDKAKAEEAKRIQDVSAIIPMAYKNNNDVQTKLFDTSVSVNDMKAFLFDLSSNEIEAEKKRVGEESKEANDEMLLINDNSNINDKTKQTTEADDEKIKAYAEQHKGSIK